MSQSRTLFSGLALHQDAMAVAAVAPDHGAEGTPPSAAVAPASVPGSNAAARCRHRPHRCAASPPPVLGAPGSSARERTPALLAGSWPPLCGIRIKLRK
jgi:hypothetical protein